MRTRIAFLFAMIILIPIILMGWLGMRLADAENNAVRSRFFEFYERDLADAERMVMNQLEIEEKSISESINAIELQQSPIESDHPLIRSIAVLDENEQLIYPSVLEPLSENEVQQLTRLAPIYSEPSYFLTENENDQSGRWVSWNRGESSGILYLQKTESRLMILAEINEVALLSHLIGSLPATNELEENHHTRTRLLNNNGFIAHQWGRYTPESDEDRPIIFRSLSEPLNNWQIDLSVDPEALMISNRPATSLILSLIAIGLVLIFIVIWLGREMVRDLKEASQKLSFVNQVSHELKTPLTNIRMYAELLDHDLDEDDQATEKKHIGVIVAESQRLSRLIENVLTFGRNKNEKHQLRIVLGSLSEVVKSTLETYRPSLMSKGIESIEFESQENGMTALDPDATEQIIGNLLSNVEKYGADGGRLRIEIIEAQEMNTVRVIDWGMGISSSHSQRIFKPFERLENKLASHSTGTGIGLTISRMLARKMGGDLKLDTASKHDAGAIFILTLPKESKSS